MTSKNHFKNAIFVFVFDQLVPKGRVTEYEIQNYFEIDECNDVIKAVRSYYNQEPAVINSWKQPRSKGNI